MTGISPQSQLVGFIEVTETEAYFINKYAKQIIEAPIEVVLSVYRNIFNKDAKTAEDLQIFVTLCEYVLGGNTLIGRQITMTDIELWKGRVAEDERRDNGNN